MAGWLFGAEPGSEPPQEAAASMASKSAERIGRRKVGPHVDTRDDGWYFRCHRHHPGQEGAEPFPRPGSIHFEADGAFTGTAIGGTYKVFLRDGTTADGSFR